MDAGPNPNPDTNGPATPSAPSLTLSPPRVFRAMLGIILLLLVLNVIGIFIWFTLEEPPHENQFVRTVYVDHAGNLPTLYATVLVTFSVILFGIIGLLHRRRQEPALAWFSLAVIFAFLAADEYLVIHERLVGPTGSVLTRLTGSPAPGILSFAWIIPYAIVGIILVLVFLRFVLRLPSPVRNPLVLGGALFVAGGFGMELAGGQIADSFLDGTPGFGISAGELGFAALATLEELLEMVGIALIVYAQLRYLGQVLNTSVVMRLEDCDRGGDRDDRQICSMEYEVPDSRSAQRNRRRQAPPSSSTPVTRNACFHAARNCCSRCFS